MEGKDSGLEIKEGADGPGQGEGTMVLKRTRHVTMGMEVLDCPVCYTPLTPPIFQCSLGHVVCSLCRDELPGTEKACGVCSRPVSDRCHGMERIVGSVVVPCSYAAHGCVAGAMAYHEMAEHEAACPHAPCFCPEKGCGFAGTTAALVDHLTAQHKWPMTVFNYFDPFEVPVKAGVHILCCRSDEGKEDDVFLLHVSWPEAPVHVVSLFRVHPHAPESRFGCSMGFSWFEGHYQVTREDTIRSTSLSEGLPVYYLCIVPEAGFGGRGRVVLRVTIDREMVYGDDYDKLFEEDGDDGSYIYDEEEDDDGSSREEEDDDGSSEEEDDDDVLEALALMEAKSNSMEKEGEALQEAESVVKKQNVTMALEVFDCPVCSNPLRPPIFQCTLGHFICSVCRHKLPDSKCQTCSEVVLKSSCFGMERIVESILVPCPYAEHGCTEMITYYRKGEHKEACPHAPCFCPYPGCGFAGSTAALLDHFTSQHKWSTTMFKYYVPFDLPAKLGLHVLRGQDGSLFLLNVALPESPLHAISIVCVQPKASEPSRFGGSVGFSCWKGHYQLSSLETITSSSLSDGLPKDCFCFVPKLIDVLRITIDTELMHDDDGELEVKKEEDQDDGDNDDDSCEEEGVDDE